MRPQYIVPRPNRPRTHDSYLACTGTLKNGLPCIFWAYQDPKAKKHMRKGPTNHAIIPVEIPPEGQSPWRDHRPGFYKAREQFTTQQLAAKLYEGDATDHLLAALQWVQWA